MNSCAILQAISAMLKPSRIGLWMYQLVALLGNGLSFRSRMRMMAHETVSGDCAPVH